MDFTCGLQDNFPSGARSRERKIRGENYARAVTWMSRANSWLLRVQKGSPGSTLTVEKARATMERQLLHLVRITDDLLDVSRITDVVFLDIGMPRMDGYEEARRIRDLLGIRVMLVALTGWGQDDDKHRSREAGFDHHLTKPPEPETLDRLIAECATRGGAADSR